MRIHQMIGSSGVIALAGYLGLMGCQVATSELDACEGGRGATFLVEGTVTRGKGLPSGTALPSPYEVDVRIQSDVLMSNVSVGGVIADLTDTKLSLWSAKLYLQDLERNRTGADATLKIVATDLCGGDHDIDQVVVPLGPAPGILVSDLALRVAFPQAWECSLPADQSAPALVRVTASKASAGAVVTVEANQGTFVGGVSTYALTLLPSSDTAEAMTYFLPAKAGAVVLNASAKGASATPVVFPVVAAPIIDAPTGPMARASAYGVTVRSRGNLAMCLTEQTIAGAATVNIIDPPLGTVEGVTSVKLTPVSCAESETLSVQVTFAKAAPDGAAVTLRCFDSFDQEGRATFTVEKGS